MTDMLRLMEIENKFKDTIDHITRIRKQTRSLRPRWDCFAAARALLDVYSDVLQDTPGLVAPKWYVKMRRELNVEEAEQALLETKIENEALDDDLTEWEDDGSDDWCKNGF